MRRLTVLFSLLSLLCVGLSSYILAEDGQKKILLTYSDKALLEELQSVAPEARIIQLSGDRVLEEIADADALIGNITPEQVRAGKKLKWVQTMGAGVERLLHL
ncbi:MAG TPA: hypothetical protein VKZ59_09450, partial [Acidobacteriota bacterium]|nr:hypothetical protein [Acidobacteriota bacterium]